MKANPRLKIEKLNAKGEVIDSTMATTEKIDGVVVITFDRILTCKNDEYLVFVNLPDLQAYVKQTIPIEPNEGIIEITVDNEPVNFGE